MEGEKPTKVEGDKRGKSRFDEYIEQFEDGFKIGFKLPDNNFMFVYDADGGWRDEDKKYYNCDGELLSDVESEQSDDEDYNDQSDDEDILD